MISEDELRLLQTRFEPERKANQSRYLDLEKLRQEFVSKFQPSQIPLLLLDDYVEGKGSPQSFCYWVELVVRTWRRTSSFSFLSQLAV
jgi:hypothetical protein